MLVLGGRLADTPRSQEINNSSDFTDAIRNPHFVIWVCNFVTTYLFRLVDVSPSENIHRCSDDQGLGLDTKELL